jgi:NAD(P)-dependent dehydrogenase (short-subunit alcohol dehydrogenase family)
MERLKDKTALITGGTSGIGLATTRRFLEEGARVAITGSRTESIATAVAEFGGRVLVLRSDAGDIGEQAVLAAEIERAFGRLDVLFVNAGIADLRLLADVDETAFDRSLNIDLKGPYFLVRALAAIFANPASIILSGSINAHLGMPNTHMYSMAKAGLISLARTLSGELISRGVRANAISPGPIDTPLNGKLGLPPFELAARARAVVALVPAGRFGRAEEVANTAVFLASDEAPFIVGAEIIIDGGLGIL